MKHNETSSKGIEKAESRRKQENYKEERVSEEEK